VVIYSQTKKKERKDIGEQLSSLVNKKVRWLFTVH